MVGGGSMRIGPLLCIVLLALSMMSSYRHLTTGLTELLQNPVVSSVNVNNVVFTFSIHAADEGQDQDNGEAMTEIIHTEEEGGDEEEEEPPPITDESQPVNEDNFQENEPFDNNDNSLVEGGDQPPQEQQDLGPPNEQDFDTDVVDESGQTVAYITYVSLESMVELERYVFWALSTWLSSSSSSSSSSGRKYHVVMSDEYREKYETDVVQQYPKFTQRIHPLWVSCPTTQFALETCCYVEKGLTQLLHNDKENETKDIPSSYQWFAYMEPSFYIRRRYLEDFLKTENAADPLMVASSQLRSLGFSSFADSEYNCTTLTTSDDFEYPYTQPMVLSRGALELLTTTSLERGGLSAQCQAFHAGYDVGMQLLGWMHSLPVLRAYFAHAQPQYVDEGDVPSVDVVLGMSELSKGTDTMTVSQAHQHYKALSTSEGFAEGHHPHPHVYHRPEGFKQTTVFQQYGDPTTWSEWHTFEPRHCLLDKDTTTANEDNPTTNSNGEEEEDNPTNGDEETEAEEESVADDTETKPEETDNAASVGDDSTETPPQDQESDSNAANEKEDSTVVDASANDNETTTTNNTESTTTDDDSDNKEETTEDSSSGDNAESVESKEASGTETDETDNNKEEEGGDETEKQEEETTANDAAANEAKKEEETDQQQQQPQEEEEEEEEEEEGNGQTTTRQGDSGVETQDESIVENSETTTTTTTVDEEEDSDNNNNDASPDADAASDETATTATTTVDEEEDSDNNNDASPDADAASDETATTTTAAAEEEKDTAAEVEEKDQEGDAATETE